MVASHRADPSHGTWPIADAVAACDSVGSRQGRVQEVAAAPPVARFFRPVHPLCGSSSVSRRDTHSQIYIYCCAFSCLQSLLIMLDYIRCLGVSLSKPAHVAAPLLSERTSRLCDTNSANPSLVPIWWWIEVRKEIAIITPGASLREQSYTRGRLRPCQRDCPPMPCRHLASM